MLRNYACEAGKGEGREGMGVGRGGLGYFGLKTKRHKQLTRPGNNRN